MSLEFKDSETMHLVGSTFWRQLGNSVENGGQPTPAGMLGGVAGLSGVATGVVGINGVHENGAAELHPVFALALNTAQAEVINGVQQNLVFFLRNFGNDGGCTRNISTWPSSLGNDENFIQLPLPAGATKVKVVPTSTLFSWQDQNTKVSLMISPIRAGL